MKDLIEDKFKKILETLKIKKQKDVWSVEVDLKKLNEVLAETGLDRSIAKTLIQEELVDTLEGKNSLFD